MIPKTIHYCWFGRNPKPKLAKKCIRSWKKYCRDYKIIEWNEDNFDLNTAPLYVRQAYEAKKWAFVTDYVRLWAMTEFGGIYMDTDVEVVKPLDQFLRHEAFSGFESELFVPTGIMACEKGFQFFRSILRYYDSAEFVYPDGTLNLITNVVLITDMCLERGLEQNGQYQVVEGLTLYPKDFFCPLINFKGKVEKTENTATIHWFAGSWLEEKERREKQKRAEMAKKYQRIEIEHTIRTLPNRIVSGILGKERYAELKRWIKGDSK